MDKVVVGVENKYEMIFIFKKFMKLIRVIECFFKGRFYEWRFDYYKLCGRFTVCGIL